MPKFISFITGGVVGAVAALLLAPAKGSDTRKQVVETIQEKVPQTVQLQKSASQFIDTAAKTSTNVINTAIDKGTEVKRDLTARVSSMAPAGGNAADANDELRAKIDAARERIAAQVAKNAEAIQDAAVDKIPQVVDAAAAAGAKVTAAAGAVKEAVTGPACGPKDAPAADEKKAEAKDDAKTEKADDAKAEAKDDAKDAKAK